MKGIILAGGSGSRLYPVTKTISKQFLLVYDKPVIYHPLTTLMDGGIKHILIITTEQYLPMYEKQLGNGSQFGIKISYKIQAEPKGIADAFIIGEEFIANDNVTLLLGDNIFLGQFSFSEAVKSFEKGAVVFSYPVENPEAFGIVEVDENGKVLSLIEKPKEPKSNLAVVGIYIYSSQVVEIAKSLEPSPRGELEITDINKMYLAKENLRVVHIKKENRWFDCGSYDSLLEVGNCVSKMDTGTKLSLGYPEYTAFENNFITKEQYLKLIDKMPECGYKKTLLEAL